MCSSLSTSYPICSSNKIPFAYKNRFNFSFCANPLFIRPRSCKPFSLAASIAEKSSNLELSWVYSDKNNDPDEFNGWDIVENVQKPVQNKRKGLPIFIVIGLGASVVGCLGLFAYFSLSRKGFRFQLRNALVGTSTPTLLDVEDIASQVADSTLPLQNHDVPEASLENVSEVVNDNAETETSHVTVKERKLERDISPFAVDSAQQEALSLLKRLKVIEDDARADQLCTRREYARWLVRANSQLERSRKHQIASLAALSGSTVTAFDDVSIQDPDFEYIQSLAEVGIINSKLSHRNGHYNPTALGGHGGFKFLPDRFISREDLVSWKAKIEYDVNPAVTKEISKKNIGFLDVREISSSALMDIFTDMLADEKSIIRRVFGQCKRFEPGKACTKAQAAVALISGRMTDLIQAEISRLEADNLSRQSEIEEIRSEILDRGEIKGYWESKLDEERSRALEVESNYRSAITALEQEKVARGNALAELLKQKAALDCQRELLVRLKDEVTEMSDTLALEKAKLMDEQHVIQDLRSSSEVNYEALLDRKSILEAEVEALRILRSWIEDEARKSKERAKVLEEAGRRWKWGDQS